MAAGKRRPGTRSRVRGALGGTPVGKALIARHDRSALVDLIARAGFVDLDWYSAATGEAFKSQREAATHYLDHGESQVPLSPLLCCGPQPTPSGPRDVDQDPMVRYLLRGNLAYMPVPVFDDAAYLAAHPDAASHPGRARGHYISSAGAGSALPVPATWGAEAPRWGPWRTGMIAFASQLRAKLIDPGWPDDAAAEPEYARYVEMSDRLVDWGRLDSELVCRDAHRVSILIPTINDWRMTDGAVGAILRNSGQHDVEIVVVDNGSDATATVGLAQALIGRDPDIERVKPIWMPVNLNFALGTNVGFAASTGARIVLLNNDTSVCPGWLDPLLEELKDPSVAGVQPLLLYGDGTVQTAGTAFPDCGGLPSHLLVAHPAEDARVLGRFDVSAATAAALAMNAGEYCRLRGLDPRFINGFEDVDMCLRALERPQRRFRVATDSTVIHFESRTRERTVTESNRQILWPKWRDRLPSPDMGDLLAAAGFQIIRWDPGVIGRAGIGRFPLPVIVRPAREVMTGPGVGHPSLRWAIKVPVAFGAPGDLDRDVADAASLAGCLRELGQDAVIDRLEAHQRPTSGLDDVVVVLAGPESFEPQPGRANLIWFGDGTVPDGHDTDTRGFDFVFYQPRPRGRDVHDAWLMIALQFLRSVTAAS